MENHPLSLYLIFCDRESSTSIATRVITIRLVTQDDIPQDCRLTLHISPDTYRQVDTQALFNLKPDVRGSVSNGEFNPDADVHLDISLHPKLFPNLIEKALTAEAIAHYLSQFQSSSPDSSTDMNLENVDPLLQTENWFALSIRQTQANKETGYRTFWSYVNLALLNAADATDESVSEQISEQLSQGVVNFFKDQLEDDWAETTQNLGNELIQGITEIFDDLGQSLTAAWKHIADDSETEDAEPDTSIQAALLAFLDEEDWSYVQLEPQSVLQLSIESNHGRWHCQAHIREAQQQLLFYSFCPISAPIDRRDALAEFMTRVNYTLAIGNFEMDFDDGEIRYRTSIDVEGDRLTPALIRQIVYTNVMTLDAYLPGLVAVIKGTIPDEAIVLENIY